MLQKWKQIIRNWINCYFNESNQDERSVNIESLLNLITHLHENLNLDESKSSKLEARTVEEFVLEKYPEFKFENETVEVSNEEEIYLAASLLLFFVCVNSKDVDIKNAMCSKLSGDDQETILNFSKSLLECSPITCRDVHTAITEACGLDMASGHMKVAETPPALRSLHGEVRRLQAALDAERFDRNYLQEELARTNLRMNKLSKDKEQCKLEILNLKAKISMCCGQEHESCGAEAEAESQGKLLRQLQDLEERLERTQEMLDDAVYERDTYKAKVEELKQDRDKWLSLSQQESDRAAQLAEKLDLERRHMHALKELVTELRQHNHRNGLDSSLLECDDPDASIHSLQHNLSVCSEACVNVVEVQLSEERAKVEALKQQLQRLQDDMNELDQKSENDKLNLERVLSERENDIVSLKHRINEEIEEKNHLKSYYDDEITKLNNEINELEQKIKENNDYSRVVIDKKMEEIKTLQEEKFSLLQSLTNETTKMEHVITGLKAELATEKQARVNMRDGYENQMMKLNEKVLNRNNELVELQNNIFEKGEMIETLQMDLRNEKEISNKYHLNVRQLHDQKREVENKLQDKNVEMTAMQLSLEQDIASVLKEIDHYKLLVSNLQDHCRDLEQNKVQLETEINGQTTRFDELIKDAENLKNSYREELEKLKIDLDEKNATINALHAHLEDEIHHKIVYQEELQKLQANKLHMSEELNKLTVEYSKQKIELTSKERMIDSLELCLKEAKDAIEKLQAENNQLNVDVAQLTNESDLKSKNIEILSSSLETAQKSLEVSVKEAKDGIEKLQAENNQLNGDVAQLTNEIDLKSKNIEILSSSLETAQKSLKVSLKEAKDGIEKLQAENDQLNVDIAQLINESDLKSKNIEILSSSLETTQKSFEVSLKEAKDGIEKLQAENDQLNVDIAQLINESDLKSKNIEILSSSLETTQKSFEVSLKEAKDGIEKLQAENDQLNVDVAQLTNESDLKSKNIEILSSSLDTTQKSLEYELSDKIETIELMNRKLADLTANKQALQSKVDSMLTEKVNLDHDLVERSKKISQLQADCEKMAKSNEENKKAIRSLDQNMTKEKQKYAALEKTYDSEMSKLMEKLNGTEKTIKELSSTSRKTIKNKDHQIHTLNNEVANLKREEENMCLVRKEKEALTQRLNEEISFKNKIEKEYQNQCTHLENITSLLNQEISTKNKEIIGLKNELEFAMKTIEGKCKDIRTLGERLSKEDQLIRDLAHQKTVETKDLQKKVSQLQSLNAELENDVKKEYECKKQAIETWQKENEQLHFAMEEDNSSHEVILKEKDSVIDRLEGQLKVNTEQLESIRKDYENITLTWESYKVETKQNIEAKEEQIKLLTQEVVLLQQNLSEVENERDRLIEKLEVMTVEMKNAETKNEQEVDKLVERIANEEIKSAVSLKENEILQNQLMEEKAAKDSLQTEKKQQSEDIKVLVEDKNKLLNEKIELTQRLTEESTIKRIFEEERNSLASDKTTLERKLLKQVTMTETLLEDKECLTQQLIEEKAARDLAEKEKENVILEKQLIEQKIAEVENNKEETSIEMDGLVKKLREVEGEKIQLLQDLRAQQKSNDMLLKENEIQIANLNIEIESLLAELRDQRIVQEGLLTDKESLLAEKEDLVKTLGVEKSAYDEKETEKDQMITKLCELNETYYSKANCIQAELEKVTQNMKSLQMDMENQEDLNKQITTTLNVGLENFVKELKNKGTTNELLQKILDSDHADTQARDKCDMLINIANSIFTEIETRRDLEKALEDSISSSEDVKNVLKQKETELFELQSEIKRLQQVVNENKIELSKRTDTYNTTLDKKVREMHVLEEDNQSITNDLNNVKLQLEVKVHSLKEKLIDNEHLTDKLKSSYECQIDNLNVMITKLSNYLKDKTAELDAARKENERVMQTIEENGQAIKALEEKLKTETQNQQKLMQDFDSERQILKDMVTVTESIMENQKVTLNKVISEHVRANEMLQVEKTTLSEQLENVKKDFEAKLQEKETFFESLFKEMAEIKFEKERVEKEINAQKVAFEIEKQNLEAKIQEKESALESAFEEIYDKGTRPKEVNIAADIKKLKSDLQTKIVESKKLQEENTNLTSISTTTVEKYQTDMDKIENRNKELAVIEIQLKAEIDELQKLLQEKTDTNKDLECTVKEKIQNIKEMEEKAILFQDLIKMLQQDKMILEEMKNTLILDIEGTKSNICFLESNITSYGEEIANLKIEKQCLGKTIEDNRKVISNLEQLLKEAQEQTKKLSEEVNNDKLYLLNKCAILQEYHDKAEIELEERRKEIISTQKELNTLKSKVEFCEEESRAKDAIVSKMSKEKDIVITSINKELQDTKQKYEKEIQEKLTTIQELKQNLEEINNERQALNILRKENEELIKAVGQRETFAAAQSQERVSSHKQSGHTDKELRDLQQQVDNTSSDMSHTSTESLKTISDLEKIILDKNRTITTLHSDVAYLKTLLAESETKLLDTTKELELSKENCHQLSTQLKKIVHQKNEEIADLKRQVSKMSVNENRASQIIKVSAKYQAIILKRIAEIKTNTVLKELTNFGNSNNYDTEVKRSLSAGTVTMEDLENFLETTDRHLRKCSEKQLALQKERDRLTEVNRIHETEILNLKQSSNEQAASLKALSTAREAYVQKLSAVTSLQRTARREILRLESSVGGASLARLERAHAAALQDLCEAALALERWLERGLRRAPPACSDAALDVQLAELQQSFARLLEQVARCRSDEPRDTVAEVRAEYEDKLDRMKSKMKQLYTEQIAVFKEKQRGEMQSLERELARTRDKLAESSRAYEEHIRGLTAELWSVGEKFLMKQDEAEWLRRKQRSGSLMSLQHVHSSGLGPVPFQEEPARPSDSLSLRSLPVHNNNGTRREGRAMHMSDEEGEVFDNRWLKELSATPRRESGVHKYRESGVSGPRESGPPGLRLSELRWRNSLCPPHLKSSYPAETQFTQAVDEEDIKCAGAAGAAGAKPQRKEVGITAYKKPGPPTPSKQAGRLSATDSELRESLRVEAEPQPSRKTSTPSRIRSLFRSNKNDTAEGTPRSRRLSNIFRKK